MLYGYARCSTNESKQDIDRQVNELKKNGAEHIYLEYEHGDSKVKKQLNELIDKVSEGDTIITLEVSRLSRSTKQLCELIDIIREKKIRLIIVGSITVDCRNGELDAMTRAFLQIAGVFSELELHMTRDRIKSGLQHAVNQGKRLGRPEMTKDSIPSNFFKHYPAYKSGSLNASEFAKVCSISRPTLYRYLKIAEG